MIRIVPMAACHIPALAEIEAVSFAAPWSADALREELTNPHAAFTVAEENGQAVGYLGLHIIAGEGFIANVAVSPAARRRGIARQMLTACIDRGREAGLCRLTLEVRKSNAPAIALYEGAGFVSDGVRPGFYAHPAEDAVIYSYYF